MPGRILKRRIDDGGDSEDGVLVSQLGRVDD